MRTWAGLTIGGFILALAPAAAGADSGTTGNGGDKPTTRPAVKGERGGKSTESRRPGRANRGDGNAYRAPLDDARDADDRPPGAPDGPGLGPKPPPGEDRPGGSMFGPDPERIRRVMQFLGEHYPRMHERLAELRDRDPRGFHRQMIRMLPRLPELMDILDRNPKLGKLMIEEHQLEMDIRDAMVEYHRTRKQDVAAQAKERVRELISRQFDIRQQKLQLMISEMERELARKKGLLSEQAARKDEVISRELQRRLSPDL